MSDDGVRRFKKGEYLFKEGESTKHLYIIQSGKVSLHLERSGKRIEVERLGVTQVCGEQAVFGKPKMAFSAVADSEVRAMEVPVELMQKQYEGSTPGVKLIFKSLTEGLRQTRNDIKGFRMEQDTSACPQMLIPKLFSIIILVADHVGKKDEEGNIDLAWGTLKIYTNRMFLESHQKVLGVLELLSKMNLVTLKYEDNEDGDRELTDLTIHDLQSIENFAEFYQYNLFKGGKAEVIYVDSLATQVARALIHCARDLENDRRGAVTLNYDDMLEEIKMVFKFELKGVHLDSLERKGLFVKRQTRDEGVFISFDKVEFEQTYTFWKIITQIDKWNEKGFVDMNDPVEEALSEGGEGGCPSCGADISEAANFCMNCGTKLVVSDAEEEVA